MFGKDDISKCFESAVFMRNTENQCKQKQSNRAERLEIMRCA